MGRLLHSAVAASFAFGGVAACGQESQTIHDAHIVGFAQPVDSLVVEDQWITHRNDAYSPTGETRNVYSHRDFTGCKEVGNGLLSLDFDDQECWTDFSCSSGKDTHCEAQYAIKFDYERLEEVTVRECPAVRLPKETKELAKSTNNQECLDAVTLRADQRIEAIGSYVLWVQAPNPKYKKGGTAPQFITENLTVNQATWDGAKRGEAVDATLSDGHITHIKLVTSK